MVHRRGQANREGHRRSKVRGNLRGYVQDPDVWGVAARLIARKNHSRNCPSGAADPAFLEVDDDFVVGVVVDLKVRVGVGDCALESQNGMRGKDGEIRVRWARIAHGRIP